MKIWVRSEFSRDSESGHKQFSPQVTWVASYLQKLGGRKPEIWSLYLPLHPLYRGKVSGRDFWHHLRSCMDILGFESCLTDPCIWRRAATKPDGQEYYEYVLLYIEYELDGLLDSRLN